MSQTRPSGDQTRIAWVDSARGLGIILVVFGHALRGLQSSQMIGRGPTFLFVDAWIYQFHMPLFFLLSGLFAERRIDRGAWVFLRDKLETLAYPYLVWSILQTLIQVAIGRHANHPTSLSELGGLLIHPIMQFWFLYALFLISVIYYLMRRLVGLGTVGTLAAFALFWATQGWLPLGDWLPLTASRSDGIYYALGSVIHRHGVADRVGRVATVFLVLTAILGYAIVTACVAQGGSERFRLVGLAATLCGIAATVALAIVLGRVRGSNLIREIGGQSLEIFVAHTIASAGLRIVLLKVFKIQDVPTHLVVETVGGVALPMLLNQLCRRYHAEFVFRYPRRRTAS